MGFVDLVEEHHGVRALPQLFGELPALLVAHVAGRRADEFGDLGGRDRTHERGSVRCQELPSRARSGSAPSHGCSVFFVASIARQVPQDQLNKAQFGENFRSVIAGQMPHTGV